MESNKAVPPSLLDKRLVFVTGKGGAGKSTVAAALAVLGMRRGRRTIVVELARRDDVSRTLRAGVADPPPSGRIGGRRRSREVYAEVEIAPGLFAISVDPELAMEEYLLDQLPMRVLAERLGSSRTFAYLAAATPGLRELLAMGKVWELAQPQRRTPDAEPYDLVVVDAPATGNAIAFLTSPRTFAGAAGVGPIARQARTIQSMVVDRQLSAVVAVASPTEASVAETMTLREDLTRELGLDIERLIVNGVDPRRFGVADDARLAEVQDELGDAAPVLLATALRAARHAHRRMRAQQAYITRLRRDFDPPPITLPHLFVDAIGATEIGRLADLLEARL